MKISNRCWQYLVVFIIVVLCIYSISILTYNLLHTCDSECEVTVEEPIEHTEDIAMIPKELITQLETHEGKHYSIYLDKFGIKTIGIGFNLESKQNQEALSHYSIDIHELLRGRELTESEILLLFSISYNTAVADVKAIFGDTYEDLPTNIQYALIDMAFNMGRGKLLQFEKMIYHLKRHEYQYAAGEILNSKWYKQVGTRGYDIYMQIHP